MDGTGRNDTNVVPLSLARLERMIQVRLAESLDRGIEPAITVKVVDSDLRSPSIPDDPAFYDLVVDRIVATLDQYLDEVADGAELSASALNHEIDAAFHGAADAADTAPRSDSFVGRLRCMSCGIVTADESSACETFVRPEPRGQMFCVGSTLDFDHDDVARDYYARAIQPAGEAPIHILEGWECPHCESVNWAEIVIRDSLVSSIWSVALSRALLERAHYVTSECVELAARITGRPAWSLLRDDLFDVLFDELEAH